MKRILFLLLLTTQPLCCRDGQLPVTYQVPHNNTYPPDVSFCIADLKFDGTMLKICEFGEGFESRFKGYDALYGKGAMWAKVWEVLVGLGVPVWIVENRTSMSDPQEFSYRYFKELGGQLMSSFGGLSRSCSAKKKIKNGQMQGLVVAHTMGKTKHYVKAVLDKRPDLMVLNAATNNFVRSKAATNALFDTPDVARFRPLACLLKGSNKAHESHNVIKKLGAEYVVIKPTNSALGQGVMLLPANQLGRMLTAITTGAHGQAMGNDPAYSYWAKNQGADVMVEAFALSKSVVVDEKAYDPTMRVVFVLVNDHGKMDITFLGSYWKLPVKSLDEPGTFTEKHKSCVKPGKKCSAVVEDADYAVVQALLCQLLPPLYEKMLKQHFVSI